MKLQIRGGRVIDPANDIDTVTDVFVAYGRITALGEAPDGYTPDRVIDAPGRYVLPGLVDMAARLRQPGEEYKATIASETRAAAGAGITTLCCPPDTHPPIDSPAEVNLVTRLAKAAGHSKVFALGALTADLDGELLSEMAALKAAGCLGVSNALEPVSTTLVLRRAMEYASSHDLTVFLHPIDFELANNGCAHEGAVASRLGLPGIPAAAETAAIGQQLALIEQTGVRAHFCRVSTARGAAMIQRAQYDGLPVTMDVCAHQLYLTEVDIGDFNSLCHTLPPLRTLRDRDGLRQCVAKGSITAICSDHQPHEEDAKLAPFPATEPGISALESLLPLTLQLADEGVVTLAEAVRRITCGPAEILGIPAGTLAVGAPADICIYDPEHPWCLDESTILSAGKNTPFIGWEFAGRVTHTLVDGRVVHELAS